MNEEALRQLSKEELIALFLEYQGQMEARVRELETKQEAMTRPAKTPTNSSLPPSTGKKANLESGKRKVGRRQRGGKSRKRVEADAVVECRVERCEQCGIDLSQERQRLVGKSQVVEIPPVQPVVVEAQRYGCQCPQCGKWQAAAHPEGMEPERVFGRRLEALVTYLHEMQHMSYQRLQTVLKTLLGLDISLGALVNVVLRVGRQLQPAAEAIREEIRGSAVVGSDETSARVGGRNHWQWVFVTDTASYHVMAASRGAKVIADVMGDAQAQVWVSDMWSAQLKAPAQQRQLCLAHQLRDLQYAIDAEHSAWAYRMQQLLRRAMRLADYREQLAEPLFQQAVVQVEADCDRLLQQRARGCEAQRLRDRYRQHRASLFIFLHMVGVPAHNNASERALRNSVIHRKVSGGFRSQEGAQTHAIVISVVDTARKRGHEVMQTLMSLLTPSAPLLGADTG